MKGKYVNFIMISGEWELYHRKEFVKSIAANFVDESETVVIEYPVSILLNLFFKFKSRLLPFLKRKTFLQKTNTNLSLFTPFVFFHYKIWNKIAVLGYIDSLLLSYQLKQLKKKQYCNDKIILWVYSPEIYNVLKFLDYDYLVYDMYDDNEYNYDGTLNEKLSALNKELILKSTLTIVVARSIYNRIKKYTDKVIYSTNGINPEFNTDSLIGENEIRKKYAGKKIIGYLGTIRSWLDFNLIEDLLKEFPKCIFMFVGYVNRNGAESFEKLKKYDNLVHIDFIPQYKTPEYLAAFDAGLIVFTVNDFTKSVFPYKFYEYLFAKIPIITTAVPELYEFKENIMYSQTKQDFIDNVRKVISGDFFVDKSIYTKIAVENSWDSKVKIIKEVLSKSLK